MERKIVRRINTICVLCGSQLGSKSCYALAASELGLKLGEQKINLVYGWGNRGLKGVFHMLHILQNLLW